jgi:hypothetical protein
MTENVPQPPDGDDAKKRRGLLRHLRKWIIGKVDELDRTDKELDRRRKELEEKNSRGTRRTDGRI